MPSYKKQVKASTSEFQVPETKSIAERDPASAIQTLLWGPPKCGKTILACTFPRPRVLDFDDGMESVLTAIRKGWIDVEEVNPADILYATIVETNREQYGYVERPTALDKAAAVMQEWVSNEQYDEWDSLVLDSLTSLGEFCIDRAMFNLGKLGSYSDSKQRSDQVHMRIMARQDWGPAMSLLTNFIEECRSYTDKNIVCVAHEHQETTESGAVTGKSPYVIGRVTRQDLPKQFDEVWRLDKDHEGTPVLHTEGTSNYVAGSRLGVEDGMESPTYQRIMESIHE